MPTKVLARCLASAEQENLLLRPLPLKVSVQQGQLRCWGNGRTCAVGPIYPLKFAELFAESRKLVPYCITSSFQPLRSAFRCPRHAIAVAASNRTKVPLSPTDGA